MVHVIYESTLIDDQRYYSAVVAYNNDMIVTVPSRENLNYVYSIV